MLCTKDYNSPCCVLTLELTDLSLEGGEVLIHIILALGSNHISSCWGLGPIALIYKSF